jgi:endogenous inhibitor of DNA gyrase (YacG/DUF329 family)
MKKRMCSWCGKKEAKIAGNRRYPSWCSKKCQQEELDNNLELDFGIDIREIRETLIEIKKKDDGDKKIAEEYGFPYK